MNDIRPQLLSTARWLWVAAAALIAPAVAVLMTFLPTAGGQSGATLLLVLAAQVIPGLLYVAFALFLPRGSAWAVYGAEMLAFFHVFVSAVVFLLALVALPAAVDSWPVAFFAGGWLVLAFETLRRIRPCADLIQLRGPESPARGFDVLPGAGRAVRVLPLPPHPSDSDRGK